MGAFTSKHNAGNNPPQSPHRHSVRDSVRENINTDNHEPHNDNSIIDRNRHNHSQAETADTASTEDWNQVVERFKASLLHESFFTHPVAGSTIEAADQYPTTTIDGEYLMPGTHKHLGGAYDPTDGCIYGVPANSRSVLCLYPDTKDNGEGKKEETYSIKAIPLPKEVQDVRMKWLRGIFAHGYLWAIPSWAPKVLCVDVDAFWGRREASPEGIVQLLDLPEDHPKDQIWQWHGAGINHEETAIYCIPSNAHQVLKVDLTSKATSLIPVQIDKEKYPDLDLTMNNKWYGGIVGKDNAVYGVCYRAGAVLRIDCSTDTAKVVGPNYGAHLYNWHGGVCVNGKIYAHPSHAETVLVIDTNAISEEGEPAISELEIHRAPYDTDPRKNYKWLGGSVGIDGNIYCPACDTSSVLKINVATDHCTTFGFAGKLKNKWQGGVLSKSRDGCVYCIPASGTQVLRIPTHPETIGNGEEEPSDNLDTPKNNEVVQLLGDLPVHKDKWQGGYEGKDGCLYFVPENGYRVMKVIPPLEPPKIVDGKLPEHDVTIEMM